SAANTSYLLAQKGYRVLQPPAGYLANAPARVFRTQVYFNRHRGARLAAVQISRLFGTADVKPLPLRNATLVTLSNGAMNTVVTGQTFSGRLIPAAVDRTPPHRAPYTRNAASETVPFVRQAAHWHVGFPL